LSIQHIGIIDEERLSLIPPEYWAAHEFCFFLHDRLAEILVEYEAKRAHNKIEDALIEVMESVDNPPDEINIIDFLKNKEFTKEYKQYLHGHIIMALTSDMLHFLYESLRCFEKRKFTVALSLLRKPLKENLWLLSWLLADENDFINRFEKENYRSFGGIEKEKRISVFNKAIEKLSTKEAFEAELIWDMIYSKKCSRGLEPYWQKATHLTTKYGELLKTDDYNFNYIFRNPFDNDIFDVVYNKSLPYLFLFLIQVSFECFSLIAPTNSKTVDYYIMSTLGCYQSIFADGRSQTMTNLLKKILNNFLVCIYCDTKLKIYKKDAPAFYLTERLPCYKCGLENEVPLFWLFIKSAFSINRDVDA
jgi:hypothetical protein